MPIRRTTHRSSKGTKLYAVRDSKGRFMDIQTYKRAHAMDIKRGSKIETAAKLKKAKKGK
jgi:DNA-binding protein HU-beta